MRKRKGRLRSGNNAWQETKKSINKENTDKRTFREVAEAWLAENRDNMATTTYDRYRETLERDVFPTYENTLIKDITLEEMNRFLTNAPGMAGYSYGGKDIAESDR